MKTLIGVLGLIFLTACSQHQDQARRAEMLRRFAAIDAKFLGEIAAANSNEIADIERVKMQVSNDVASAFIPTNSLQAASNSLDGIMNVATVKLKLMIEVARREADLVRMSATNRLIEDKLNFFFTNSMPDAEAPSVDISNSSLAGFLQNLQNSRQNDVLLGGLHELADSVERMTNQAPQLSARELRQQQLAQEYQQSAIALGLAREQQAAKATAVRFAGSVFQVVEGGALCNRYGPDGVELCMITDSTISDMADGTQFAENTFYPIGTYRYSTVAGGSRQVKRFTMSLDRAVEYRRAPY